MELKSTNGQVDGPKRYFSEYFFLLGSSCSTFGGRRVRLGLASFGGVDVAVGGAVSSNLLIFGGLPRFLKSPEKERDAEIDRFCFGRVFASNNCFNFNSDGVNFTGGLLELIGVEFSVFSGTCTDFSPPPDGTYSSVSSSS